MNRMEQLIEELCPEGVEYKEMGEVTNIKRGERVTKADIIPLGKFPIISGGVKPLGYLDKYNRDANTITICQYGTAGYVDWQNENFWANDVCYSLYPNNSLNNRFLYFYLLDIQEYLYSIRTNAIPAHLPIEKLKSINVPIPPLPIQQEIVTILDTFTALDGSLQAELEARRKQYEHYRNQLLNFEGKEVEWKTLGEVGNIQRGVRVVRNQLLESGKYPVYQNSMKPLGYFDKSNFKANTTFIISAGAAGDIGYSDVDFWAADDCFLCLCPDNLKSKFLYYFLLCNQNYLYSRVRRASVPRLSRDVVEKIQIPIPPLSEQERIVGILDKFDALVNTELPAEIDARRKQYEYYREKLLTFEPK